MKRDHCCDVCICQKCKNHLNMCKCGLISNSSNVLSNHA